MRREWKPPGTLKNVGVALRRVAVQHGDLAAGRDEGGAGTQASVAASRASASAGSGPLALAAGCGNETRKRRARRARDACDAWHGLPGVSRGTERRARPHRGYAKRRAIGQRSGGRWHHGRVLVPAPGVRKSSVLAISVVRCARPRWYQHVIAAAASSTRRGPRTRRGSPPRRRQAASPFPRLRGGDHESHADEKVKATASAFVKCGNARPEIGQNDAVASNGRHSVPSCTCR